MPKVDAAPLVRNALSRRTETWTRVPQQSGLQHFCFKLAQLVQNDERIQSPAASRVDVDLSVMLMQNWLHASQTASFCNYTNTRPIVLQAYLDEYECHNFDTDNAVTASAVATFHRRAHLRLVQDSKEEHISRLHPTK